MLTYKTPNRHGYSVKFSPFNPGQLVVATSQYYGFAGTVNFFSNYFILGYFIDCKFH